jgi:hypothetical protein
MGLTLFYELCSDVGTLEEAVRCVESLRTKALGLGFAEVHELEIFNATEMDELRAEIRQGEAGGAAYLLGMMACFAKNQQLSEHLGKDRWHEVEPIESVHFSILPGPGSESAAIGLSHFPEVTRCDGRDWPTGLHRWHWQSFCKTQYASNPAAGGIDHFLRCHLGLVELFDFAAAHGWLERVGDDGGYWENRDREKLIAEVRHMNELVAAVAGAFKDAAPKELGGIVVPITEFPDFEHIEARGQKHTRLENE